jgi:hypothetical protein
MPTNVISFFVGGIYWFYIWEKLFLHTLNWFSHNFSKSCLSTILCCFTRVITCIPLILNFIPLHESDNNYSVHQMQLSGGMGAAKTTHATRCFSYPKLYVFTNWVVVQTSKVWPVSLEVDDKLVLHICAKLFFFWWCYWSHTWGKLYFVHNKLFTNIFAKSCLDGFNRYFTHVLSCILFLSYTPISVKLHTH